MVVYLSMYVLQLLEIKRGAFCKVRIDTFGRPPESSRRRHMPLRMSYGFTTHAQDSTRGRRRGGRHMSQCTVAPKKRFPKTASFVRNSPFLSTAETNRTASATVFKICPFEQCWEERHLIACRSTTCWP